MGGFFGVTSRRNCILDVFFGTDYHSHLGTRRGGMAAYDLEVGMQREIHNIENSPFRTKFEHILDHMTGCAAAGKEDIQSSSSHHPALGAGICLDTLRMMPISANWMTSAVPP